MRGSVRKPRTAGGTWSYRLDLGLDDRGRRRQREVGGFRTKKDAQASLNDALAGSQRGTYVAPSRATVARVLRRVARGREVRPGGRGVDELRPDHPPQHQAVPRREAPVGSVAARCQALARQLLEGGRADGGPLAVRSVQLSHRVLHRALADAVRWNLIADQPGVWCSGAEG